MYNQATKLATEPQSSEHIMKLGWNKDTREVTVEYVTDFGEAKVGDTITIQTNPEIHAFIEFKTMSNFSRGEAYEITDGVRSFQVVREGTFHFDCGYLDSNGTPHYYNGGADTPKTTPPQVIRR
jgi:hypothetical protein